ncbi:MAG: hypothetical protein RL373_27 [Pseudomonadota bacterium]|jgi:hypothetical protein
MKYGQWMVVVKHDEDPSLVGRLVVVVAPRWWNSNSKNVDVQLDDSSTTFIHENGLRPASLSKEVRKEMIVLYDVSYLYKKAQEK